MSDEQTIVKARAIQAGYAWTLRITMSGAAAFAEDATFTSQIRKDSRSDVLATLSTALGTITRLSARVIELALPGDASTDWPTGTVKIDVVRTDGAEPEHLGFILTVPVRQTITRGL